MEQLQDQGQTSLSAAGSKPVPPSPLSSELLSQLWSWETRGPAPKGIFQMYENQCQLFLLAMGLEKSMWIDHRQFQQMWHQSEVWGVENLFVEILARREIQLSDPYSAFMIIGDLGARIFLYYTSLESQWSCRHQFSKQSEGRRVSWQEYGTQVSSQLYSQPLSKLQEWRETLQKLLIQLRQPDRVTESIRVNIQRLSVVPSEDFLASHYLYQFDRVVNRLEGSIRDLNNQKRPLLNLHGQIQFDLPPATFTPVHKPIEMPVTGSPLTLHYLGQYENLFDLPTEKPIPSWKAISWLLEDYGLSRTEEVPADIHYRRVSRQWSAVPPVAVSSHPHFCDCPRRCKWNPFATLSSLEYNWPLIPGPKSTAAECKATYGRFFQDHIHHCDPVCYRAAVFSNILADWCGQWNITIDVNHFHESHHEFLLLLKLQYRPTRWVRLVEAMAITHFIAGAHKCLINEFPNTRAGPFERFLRWQRLHAPELVARDEDVQKALEKVETRELKRGAAEAAHWGGPPPKLLRK